MFFDVATHLVAEAAASYGLRVLQRADGDRGRHAGAARPRLHGGAARATVVSVQIAECSLPQMFNDAVTHTVTQRQNITAAQKYLDSERVSLATELLVARRNANAVARGRSRHGVRRAARGQRARASRPRRAVYEARACATMATLNLSTAQMLEYICVGRRGGRRGRAAGPRRPRICWSACARTLVRSAAPA